MAVKVYNKLVRDKIPEIIEADGKSCKTKILSDEEYLKMIDAKLDEELAEYHKDQNIEELADCQTAHCGRGKPHFDFGENPSPIVLHRNLPQAQDGMTADYRSLV